MTIEEIRKNAPEGATHYDEQDYWKSKDGDFYIWLDSVKKWRRIFRFKMFHDHLPIKPL